jgi:hypothetical protein
MAAAIAALERETRSCETCGASFEAAILASLGARIAARHCPACVERRALRLEREQQQRTVRARPPGPEERWAALCPPEFRTLTEGGRTDPARLARECPALPRILAWRGGERGLLLCGPTGRSKTRAVWRLLRRLFDSGQAFEAHTAGEFGRSYADAAGAYRATAWFDRLTTVDALFLDDLGKAAWSEAVRAVFFDVVDKRTRTGRALLVTTNDDGETLASRFPDPHLSDPLIRRLREYCEVIPMGRAPEE